MSAATRGRNAHSDEKTVTWADAHGRWHVRIELPSPGYGPAELKQWGERLRRKARRAVRREIEARGTVGAGWRCRIEVEERDLTPDDVTRSITWREKTD